MKFSGEPKGEASGTYPNGEVWHVKFDARGEVDVKDELIAEMLTRAAAHPDSPINKKAASEEKGGE